MIPAVHESDWDEKCATYEMARLDNLEWIEDDKEGELISSAHTHALMSLLRSPAPDIAALAYKLQVYRDEDAHELYVAPEIVDLMIGDARRLAVKA